MRRRHPATCFLVLSGALVLSSCGGSDPARDDLAVPDVPDSADTADVPVLPDAADVFDVADTPTHDIPSDPGPDAPADIPGDLPTDVPIATGCNGAEALCSKRFNEVAYPTTHNAMSNEDEGWIAPNQPHGIERQLEDGVRGMMLDLHYGDGDTTDAATVYLCHSECILGNRPLLDALVAIKAFLDLHPRDVLTLIFESYVSGGDVAAAFEAAGLLPTLHAQDVNQPWPALGAMGDTGRRLVVFTNRDAGATPWYHDQWAYTFENPWSAKTRTDLSCDVDRGHPSNSLYTLNHFASNPFPDPEEAALTNSNPFFVDQAQKCWTERNHLPNFPTVDFYDLGDLFAVVRTLNGLDADPAP